MAQYKRILLKLSGESLMGEKQYGIDKTTLLERYNYQKYMEERKNGIFI